MDDYTAAKTGLWVVVLYLIGCLTVIGVTIWSIVHFISKLW